MLILTARHGTPGASRSDPVEGERESTEVRILLGPESIGAVPRTMLLVPFDVKTEKALFVWPLNSAPRLNNATSN